jgi:peroxiredoxin/outer membrane lipoprotein-sorting protein
MKYILLLVLPALAQDSDPALPKKVLAHFNRVADHAKAYEFEGLLTVSGQRGTKPGRVLGKAKFHYAAADGGRYYLRIEPVDKDEYLLVSDGKKSWAYVPKLKQYTEDESAEVAGDDEESAGGDDERDVAETFARMIVPVLGRMPKSAQAADVNGSAEVRSEGRKEQWPKVRVMSKKDAEGGQELMTLAVDPATLKLGQLRWTRSEMRDGEKSLYQMEVEFSSFQIGEKVSDDRFVFDPPKKTKLVESVPIPGQTGSFLLNKPAPDVELKTLDGEKVRISELKGKPVLLDFWASWCGPCRRELPSIVKLHEEFKEKGLVVLGVNDEGKKDAASYTREAHLTFPTLDDSGYKAHRAYRVRSIPSVFLIDRDGNVVKFFKGARSEGELRTALRGVGL